MALDFGGFGKEYAVDIVAQIARRPRHHRRPRGLRPRPARARARLPAGRPGTSASRIRPRPGRTSGQSRRQGQRASPPPATTSACFTDQRPALRTYRRSAHRLAGRQRLHPGDGHRRHLPAGRRAVHHGLRPGPRGWHRFHPGLSRVPRACILDRNPRARKPAVSFNYVAPTKFLSALACVLGSRPRSARAERQGRRAFPSAADASPVGGQRASRHCGPGRPGRFLGLLVRPVQGVVSRPTPKLQARLRRPRLRHRRRQRRRGPARAYAAFVKRFAPALRHRARPRPAARRPRCRSPPMPTCYLLGPRRPRALRPRRFPRRRHRPRTAPTKSNPCSPNHHPNHENQPPSAACSCRARRAWLAAFGGCASAKLVRVHPGNAPPWPTTRCARTAIRCATAMFEHIYFSRESATGGRGVGGSGCGCN